MSWDSDPAFINVRRLDIKPEWQNDSSAPQDSSAPKVWKTKVRIEYQDNSSEEITVSLHANTSQELKDLRDKVDYLVIDILKSMLLQLNVDKVKYVPDTNQFFTQKGAEAEKELEGYPAIPHTVKPLKSGPLLPLREAIPRMHQIFDRFARRPVTQQLPQMQRQQMQRRPSERFPDDGHSDQSFVPNTRLGSQNANPSVTVSAAIPNTPIHSSNSVFKQTNLSFDANPHQAVSRENPLTNSMVDASSISSSASQPMSFTREMRLFDPKLATSILRFANLPQGGNEIFDLIAYDDDLTKEQFDLMFLSDHFSSFYKVNGEATDGNSYNNKNFVIREVQELNAYGNLTDNVTQSFSGFLKTLGIRDISNFPTAKPMCIPFCLHAGPDEFVSIIIEKVGDEFHFSVICSEGKRGVEKDQLNDKILQGVIEAFTQIGLDNSKIKEHVSPSSDLHNKTGIQLIQNLELLLTATKQSIHEKLKILPTENVSERVKITRQNQAQKALAILIAAEDKEGSVYQTALKKYIIERISAEVDDSDDEDEDIDIDHYQFPVPQDVSRAKAEKIQNLINQLMLHSPQFREIYDTRIIDPFWKELKEFLRKAGTDRVEVV